MRVFVEGVAVRAPGLGGWPESRAVLAGIEAYRAAPAELPASPLPPAERRRTAPTVKLALALAGRVLEHCHALACAVDEHRLP